MKKNRILITIFLVLFMNLSSQGQEETGTNDDYLKSIRATNFTIPSSPAFMLLDVNPSKVNRPGFIKDFSFDWILKDNQLAPDIALDIRPVWLLFFKETNMSEYQRMKWLSKALSSLSFSLGTTRNDDIRSMAFSAKITLFREKSLMDKELVKKVWPKFSVSEKVLVIEKALLESELINKKAALSENGATRTLSDKEKEEVQRKIKAIQERIKAIDIALDYILKRERAQRERIIEEYRNKYWNSAALDVGFGKIYTYTGESLKELDLDNIGTGIWINGCFGIGKKILTSSLFKYIEKSGEKSYSGGINLRYGSSKFNLFVEGFYEDIRNSDENNDKITIAYGGDIKISSTLLLEFGIRKEYNKDFEFSNLIPIINLKWIADKN